MNTTYVSTQNNPDSRVRNGSRSEGRNKTIRMGLRCNALQCNASAPGTTPSRSFGKTLTAFNSRGAKARVISSSLALEAAEEVSGVKEKLRKREAELNRLRSELMKLRKEVARLKTENEKYKDLFKLVDVHKLAVLIDDKELARNAFITKGTISVCQPVNALQRMGDSKNVYTAGQTPKSELAVERTFAKTIGTVYYKG